jgi:hypothetical protein
LAGYQARVLLISVSLAAFAVAVRPELGTRPAQPRKPMPAGSIPNGPYLQAHIHECQLYRRHSPTDATIALWKTRIFSKERLLHVFFLIPASTNADN